MQTLLFMLSGAVLTIAGLIAASRLVGFMAQTPEDYVNSGKVFDIREKLSGPILCEGVIYGPTGRVSSRFTADMNGVWEGNRGSMTERFHYDSGTVQNRAWTLALGNDGVIRAEAPDLIGSGRGRQMGSAVQLKYRIRLPESAGGHVLDVTDWMYLTENDTIINRSQFHKYGIKVAELVATMRKHPT